MKTYHIGLGVRGRTMVIEARRCVDYLDCETYSYEGEREVTKAHLRAHRYDILRYYQRRQPGIYGGLRYAVVE